MNHLTPIIGAESLPTIKVGSTGPYVEQWQKVIGVSVDGKFGPATEAATKDWQKKKGLNPDGVVGPKTWAATKVTVNLAGFFTWIPLWAKVAVGLFIPGYLYISKRK